MRTRWSVTVLLLALVMAACAPGAEVAGPPMEVVPELEVTGPPADVDAAADPDEAEEPPEPATEDPTPVEPDPSPEATVAEALAFTAPLLAGGTFDGVDYAGRDVALWFWAPW